MKIENLGYKSAPELFGLFLIFRDEYVGFFDVRVEEERPVYLPFLRMDLNHLLYFAKGSDKEQILLKIQRGVIDRKVFYERKREFDQLFEYGVQTPIQIVTNESDAYFHIINRHPEMFTDDATSRIYETLVYPNEIFRTKDKYGNEAISYFKPIKNQKTELMVVTRNGIITAYEAKPNYVQRQKRKGEQIWSQK
ncbi:hypothetical protein JEQ21_00590 [Streptococcus sp. 121]|uniref:hypothetical protein n=1 Tax=Streptococcus sp. 121 TaxID=2797637 RepID=UPI0018F0F8EE|nr:hypothetical protein [Streptococcus sp. 121]MBJ6744966.1 hypothetical protein [Streptococcus sp. 121]